MSLTIPFRVYGSYHYHKINDDLIDTCENCPVFTENSNIDIKIPQSSQLFDYCRSESCTRQTGNYYEHLLLVPVGVSMNEKINRLIYDSDIRSITIGLTKWNSMLSICPHCYKFYYVPDIKTHMENIVYKTPQTLSTIVFNHDDKESLNKYIEQSLLDDVFVSNVIKKIRNPIKNFIDCEISTYTYLIFNNYINLYSQLTNMYEQVLIKNMKQFTFSIGLIWLTKVFYISDCINIPPTSQEEYHELFDHIIEKYIIDRVPNSERVSIQYDLTNIEDININNILENSVEITVYMK